MTIFFILIFILSCFLMSFAGNRSIKALSNISEYLGWKEFTVAFILMSFATAAPELFIGISSAMRGVSELSLGNILGQNIIHFSVAIFICVYIRGSFSVGSKTIRITSLFSALMAAFPLLLVLDGSLSRIDGVVLIASFVFYILWLASRRKRFEEQYSDTKNTQPEPIFARFKMFINGFGQFFIGIFILILAAQGIVQSSLFFAESLGMSLVVVGSLIVGFGTSMPEVYFSALAAKKGDAELMAGNLLGSTVVSTSLVLGIVSIISPITNITLFSYALSRSFLFILVILFIIFSTTDRKITMKEGAVLLAIYLLFVITEIFI